MGRRGARTHSHFAYFINIDCKAPALECKSVFPRQRLPKLDRAFAFD